MSKYTRDAFKSLDLLEDTEFELTDKDSFEELGDFIENEDGDVKDTTIVDLDAETEEEIKDSYVGDVILSCPVCRTNLFKATDEVTVEDEAELCCVGDPCPICGQEDGFKIIGKVAPFEEVKDEEETEVEVETEPDEAEVEVKEKVRESFKKRIYRSKLNEQAKVRKAVALKEKKNIKTGKKLNEAKVLGVDIDDQALRSYVNSLSEGDNITVTADLLDVLESANEIVKKAVAPQKQESRKPLKARKLKEGAVETRDVTDQVIVKRGEPGFISKMHDLRDKGYECISSGDGQMCFAKPKTLKKEECKQVNEEVSDLAYDMAEEIDKRFAGEKFISWDDFNEAFEDAYPGVIDPTDSKFSDLETDVRGILGYLGWETIYEGEDEGGLRMLESRRPVQRRKLTESKGDLQKLPQEVQDIVGEVFDYTMNFDFLDVVADVLLRVDDYEQAAEDAWEEVDEALIYIDDQWEVLRYYFDNPADLDSESWDTAFSHFVNDIQKVCAEVVADKQIKADAEEMDAEDDDYDGEESLKKSGKGKKVESIPTTFPSFKDWVLDQGYSLDELDGMPTKDYHKLYADYKADKEDFIEVQRRSNESLSEAIENATIETEDQVIKVSSEEKEEDMNADWYERESMGDGELLGGEAEDEMIVPLSDEDMEEIEEPAEEEETEETTEDDFVETDEEEMPEDEDEFDFEEVQEESFNRLVGKYLTNTYKNIKSYKVTGKDIKEGLVKIDGEIEFKSGNKRNTTFVFEAKRDQSSISRKKMRFVGLNETFTDKKNAYVLNAKKVGKQMVAESLRYNYPAKAKNLNENLKVVKGLVK